MLDESKYIARARFLKHIINQSLDAHKAADIVEVDLVGKSDMAYYMLVATGTSTRHVSSLAKHVREAMALSGVTDVTVEGGDGDDWVLIDTPYVIVHLFLPEARYRYGIEQMWQAEFSEEASAVS